MPTAVSELLLVGTCNGWSLEAAKQSYCFKPEALSETVWRHECQLQLDKTGELEFQVISKQAAWGWCLYPERREANKLVCGNPNAVKASLSLFEEDAYGQNFHLAGAAGAQVAIKVQLSSKELLVWYDEVESGPLPQQPSLAVLQELPQNLQESGSGRWVTVVWPYVPMRDKPDVSGKLVSVVKHGAQLEFEDLAPGRPVTLPDLLENDYLKIWSIGPDGARLKTGWVSCASDHGVHFAPFSESKDAQEVLKPLLDLDNIHGRQQQFQATFQGQRNFKLNMLPRAEPVLADLPPSTADLVLLKSHRRYAPVAGPFAQITLCGLPGGCTPAVSEWLLRAFKLDVTSKSLAWLANSAYVDKVRQAGAGSGLLLVLLESPLAWAVASLGGIGSLGHGCWSTALRRGEGDLEFEYVPEEELGRPRSGVLRGPLLFEGLIHSDGPASVWSALVRGAMAAAAGVENVAVMRVEDLLFRTADMIGTLEDVVPSRCSGGGDVDSAKSMDVAQSNALLTLLRAYTRLNLLQPDDVSHVTAITANTSVAVGYGDPEQVRKWALLARDTLGWLQEGEYTAFDSEDGAEAQEALEFLAANGYVVFRNIADPTEIEKAEELLWEFMSHSSLGIKRGVPSSWALPAFSRKLAGLAEDQKVAMWPAEEGTGIISSNAIGQSAFMWHLRGLPRLRKAFALIFGTEDLITSFDGAGVFRPYGHDPSWKSKSTWYHVDQGDGKHGFHSVQGLVSLTRASAETGGLVVVPGSHLCHEDLLKRPESRGSGRLHLDNDDPVLRQYSKDSAGAVLVPLQPGDAVLWDSRTVHCSTHALRDASSEVLRGKDLLRVVGYISMSPTAWANQETLEKRADVFGESRKPLMSVTTTHNAHDMHIVREGSMSDAIAPELSDAQLELALGRDGGIFSTCPLDPGQPSFLPARTYRCTASAAPVRNAPSVQHGDSFRRINGGGIFRAHRFGEWLRLDDEEWVQACHAELEGPRLFGGSAQENESEDLLLAAAAAAWE